MVGQGRQASRQTSMSSTSLCLMGRFRRLDPLARFRRTHLLPHRLNLQAAINAATGGPVAFGNDGFSLTPQDEPILAQVADKLKACPTAHATLNGYTDNSGTEAINIPLSAQRAGTVADSWLPTALLAINSSSRA